MTVSKSFDSNLLAQATVSGVVSGDVVVLSVIPATPTSVGYTLAADQEDATYDIVVTKNGEKQTNVPVSIFVGKYLTGVALYHGNDSSPLASSYDADTGILTFIAPSFSEYHVVIDKPLYVATAAELTDAVADPGPGKIIKLSADITLTDTVVFSASDHALDLNGKKIVMSGDGYIRITGNNNKVTSSEGSGVIERTDGIVKSTSDVSMPCIGVYGGANALIENLTVTSNGYDPVYVSNSGSATISNCTVTNNGTTNTNCVALGVAGKGTLTVKSGTYSVINPAAVLDISSVSTTTGCFALQIKSSGGTINVQGGTFNGEVLMDGRSGAIASLNITGGTFNNLVVYAGIKNSDMNYNKFYVAGVNGGQNFGNTGYSTSYALSGDASGYTVTEIGRSISIKVGTMTRNYSFKYADYDENNEQIITADGEQLTLTRSGSEGAYTYTLTEIK